MGSSSSCASPPNAKRGTQATSHTAFSASATHQFHCLCLIPTNAPHHVTCSYHDYQRTHPPTTLPVDSPGLLQHFTDEGWLTPVVDPYGYNPEPGARAFVVLMYRAWAAMAASQTNQWKQEFCENEQRHWSAEVFNKCWDQFYVGYFDAEIRMFTHNAVRRMATCRQPYLQRCPLACYNLWPSLFMFCTYFELSVNDL